MGRLIDAVVELAKEALGVTELQAKLHACSDACELSEDAEPLKPGDPAWSHAYEDVADLRRDWERLVSDNRRLRAECQALSEDARKSQERRLELVALADALGVDCVQHKMLERIAELKGDDAKPTWGDWEPPVIYGEKEPTKVYVRAQSVPDSDLLFAKESEWGRLMLIGCGPATQAATDIDDAREKADAWLVARGELEAERAFKRLGDWRSCGGGVLSRELDWRMVGVVDEGGWFVTDVRMHSDDDGPTVRGAETGDAGKEAADAELVRRGLLDPSRAFKVGTK